MKSPQPKLSKDVPLTWAGFIVANSAPCQRGYGLECGPDAVSQPAWKINIMEKNLSFMTFSYFRSLCNTLPISSFSFDPKMPEQPIDKKDGIAIIGIIMNQSQHISCANVSEVPICQFQLW